MTSISAEGLELTDKLQSLVIDEPDGFAEILTRMYNNFKLLNEISYEVINFITASYNTETVDRALRWVIE
jgi:hypothetical protein